MIHEHKHSEGSNGVISKQLAHCGQIEFGKLWFGGLIANGPEFGLTALSVERADMEISPVWSVFGKAQGFDGAAIPFGGINVVVTGVL